MCTGHFLVPAITAGPGGLSARMLPRYPGSHAQKTPQFRPCRNAPPPSRSGRVQPFPLGAPQEKPMSDLFKLKRPNDPHTGQMQEEHLITLQDDTTRPPPTIGTPSWMSIIGGPSLGQPSGNTSSLDHSPATSRFWSWLWLILLFGFLVAIFVRAIFYS